MHRTRRTLAAILTLMLVLAVAPAAIADDARQETTTTVERDDERQTATTAKRDERRDTTTTVAQDRPTDTRPVTDRPTDTRPVTDRPTDTRPVTDRPTDTRPEVDTRPVDRIERDHQRCDEVGSIRCCLELHPEDVDRCRPDDHHDINVRKLLKRLINAEEWGLLVRLLHWLGLI